MPTDSSAARALRFQTTPRRAVLEGVEIHRTPLRVRSILRERRPVAVRRHAARLAKRTTVLLVSDLLAALLVQITFAEVAQLRAWVDASAARALFAGPPLLSPLAIAVVAALAVTGNYGRRRGLYAPLKLLVAGSLAVLAVLVPAAGLPASREPWLAYGAVALSVALAIWAGRTVAERFLAGVWPGARGAAAALLIGRTPEDRAAVESVISAAEEDYRVVGYAGLDHSHRNGSLGTIHELAQVIETYAVETVIVGCYLPDEQIRTVLDVCVASGCELLYRARAVKIAGVRPTLVWHQDQPFFELGAPVLNAQALIIKRVMDLAGASAAIVFLAPVFAVIALAIRLDSRGPVFFTQDRAGLGGRRFRMLKFRTMRSGADDEKDTLSHLNHTGDARLFKIPNDPRVTRVGAWLRRWSLDELPQLWNVLANDMSLVGPRPFFQADLDTYEDHHFRRLDAKPGITGLWQVNGRSDVVDFEEVVRYDREYIESWSLGMDLSVILRTMPAVFRRTGAY